MSYELSLKRLPNFFRYVNKVYKFSKTISSMEGNEDAEVSASTIFMSVFMCLLLRMGSLRQLAGDVQSGKIRKFLPDIDKETFCANTIGNGLEEIDVETLCHELSVVPRKLRRNRAYGTASHPKTIGGLKIAALDGTEYFRSENINCPDCMEVHIKTKEGILVNYTHKIVLMYLVGRMDESAVQVLLGAEPAYPKDAIQGEESGHEGESTAAKRLLEKMIDLYGKNFFHVLTTDALYTTNPFVTLANSLGKYLVSRVKREDTTLYQEIEVLSERIAPIHIDDRENRVESWIYEIDQIQGALDWDIPTRGFKIIEKDYKITKGNKVYTKQETFLCMTTLPKEKAAADVVRQIVHAKWGIENNAIKDLKDNWHMTHNFHHTPNATYAVLLIMFIAYNLFYAYVFRHLKSYRLYHPTMKRIIEDFISSYHYRKWPMSWIYFDDS